MGVEKNQIFDSFGPDSTYLSSQKERNEAAPPVNVGGTEIKGKPGPRKTKKKFKPFAPPGNHVYYKGSSASNSNKIPNPARLDVRRLSPKNKRYLED